MVQSLLITIPTTKGTREYKNIRIDFSLTVRKTIHDQSHDSFFIEKKLSSWKFYNSIQVDYL